MNNGVKKNISIKRPGEKEVADRSSVLCQNLYPIALTLYEIGTLVGASLSVKCLLIANHS